MSNLQTEKTIVQESLGGELSPDVVSKTREWMDEFTVM